MIENKQKFLELTGLHLGEILATLDHAAKAANARTLPLFRTQMTVDNKHEGGFDPVTIADRDAEQAIRDVIARAFPDHAIIGEEHAVKQTGSDCAWVIDPIDGTRSFISGVPLWGTLIAFTFQGRALAGLMSQPFTGETFVGAPGSALYHRDGTTKILATSGCTELSGARLFTTSPDLFDTPERQRAWSALDAASLQTRYGCDCYAFCLLAAGHADLVVEAALNVYDIAALIPIIEQAGGHVATWQGGPADQGGDIIAAASRPLLDAALEKIATSRTA